MGAGRWKMEEGDGRWKMGEGDGSNEKALSLFYYQSILSLIKSLYLKTLYRIKKSCASEFYHQDSNPQTLKLSNSPTLQLIYDQPSSPIGLPKTE